MSAGALAAVTIVGYVVVAGAAGVYLILSLRRAAGNGELEDIGYRMPAAGTAADGWRDDGGRDEDGQDGRDDGGPDEDGRDKDGPDGGGPDASPRLPDGPAPRLPSRAPGEGRVPTFLILLFVALPAWAVWYFLTHLTPFEATIPPGYLRAQPPVARAYQLAAAAPADPQVAALGRGAAVYLSRCALCHGDDGQGTSQFVAAKALLGDALVRSLTPDELQTLISNGFPADMPAWGQELGSGQLRDVTLYVKDVLGPAQPPSTGTAPAPARQAPAGGTAPPPARRTAPPPAGGTTPPPNRGTAPLPAPSTTPAPTPATTPAPERTTAPAPAGGTARPAPASAGSSPPGGGAR